MFPRKNKEVIMAGVKRIKKNMVGGEVDKVALRGQILGDLVGHGKDF